MLTRDDVSLVTTQHYAALLKDADILDIVTVGQTDYALVVTPRGVPGCVTIPVTQLAAHLRDFLTSGYSHRHRQPYRQVAGVFAWTIFTYSLESLAGTRKQVFSHALAGTATREGLLTRWQGQKLGRGAFLVPTPNEADATTFLVRWGVPYTREVILRER